MGTSSAFRGSPHGSFGEAHLPEARAAKGRPTATFLLRPSLQCLGSAAREPSNPQRTGRSRARPSRPPRPGSIPASKWPRRTTPRSGARPDKGTTSFSHTEISRPPRGAGMIFRARPKQRCGPRGRHGHPCSVGRPPCRNSVAMLPASRRPGHRIPARPARLPSASAARSRTPVRHVRQAAEAPRTARWSRRPPRPPKTASPRQA